MYGLATKRTEKNEPKKRERNFLRQTIRCALVVLRSVIFTDFVNFGQSRFEFGCVHELYPLNRIVRTFGIL